MIDTFSTATAKPPAAFDRLRADLHNAAGPERIAASRTRDTIDQLRTRADFLAEAGTHLFPASGLGDWYIELADRLNTAAAAIERAGQFEGVLS